MTPITAAHQLLISPPLVTTLLPPLMDAVAPSSPGSCLSHEVLPVFISSNSSPSQGKCFH